MSGSQYSPGIRLSSGPSFFQAKHSSHGSVRSVFSQEFQIWEQGLRARLSGPARVEWEELHRESEPSLYLPQLLNFGTRLLDAGREDLALEVFSVVADLVPPAMDAKLQGRAQSLRDAVLGKGALGGRAEYLLKNFCKEATNVRVILPMLAGSVVAGLARTAALGRLAASPAATWYSRGLGAKFSAGFFAYAAEVPAFALTSRALRHLGAASASEPSLGQELASAALTLGALKLSGAAASPVLNRFAKTPFGLRHAEALHFLGSQGSMFAGLFAAHRLEEQLGLKRRVDGATTVVDILSSMASLGVGGHLGHRLLGPGIARLQGEMELRLEAKERAKLGASHWLGHPLLAPMWLALGAGGVGGGLAGKKIAVSSRDLELKRDEAQGGWRLEGLEENRADAEALFAQAKQEAARAVERNQALGEGPDLKFRESWERQLEHLMRRKLPFWEAQIKVSAQERALAQARYLQDIGIGIRRMLSRINQLLAELYAEALPGEIEPEVGLRRPRPVRLSGRDTRDVDILPALRNYDIGFGEELSLRPHQVEALSRVRGWMQANREKLTAEKIPEEKQELLQGTLVMPVGGGKTRVMIAAFATAIDLGLFRPGQDKFLILNHTNQIHQQNLNVAGLLGKYFETKFGRPLKISEYKAEQKDLSGDLVVLSIPTVREANGRQQFIVALAKTLGSEGKIPLVTVDEVHHLGAGIQKGLESWQELLKGLRQISPAFFRLGFTATPTGHEGAVLYKVGVMELMRAGITPRTYLCKTPGMELVDIPLRGGNFDEEELTNTLIGPEARRKRHIPLLEALERHGIRRGEPSPSGKARLEGVLGFASGLRHARALAEDYGQYFAQSGGELRNRRFILLGGEKGKVTPQELTAALPQYRGGEIDGIVAVVSGATRARERDTIFAAVTTGEIEAVISVDALVEGADLYMFTHQLGARPTFSVIKKGQERGRINRRGPDEVDPDGIFLKDRPKILFEVMDSYNKTGQALIPYGLVMGLLGYADMKGGELYDLMTSRPQAVERADLEGGKVGGVLRVHDPLSPQVRRPDASKPHPITPPDLDPAWEKLTGELGIILQRDYSGDLEAMAWDLGESEEYLTRLLHGEGWQNRFWYLRRMATLLYQDDRDMMTHVYNDGLSKNKVGVTDSDYEILAKALKIFETRFAPHEGGKIKKEMPWGIEEIELTRSSLKDFHLRRLADFQWRKLWCSLYCLFAESAKEIGQIGHSELDGPAFSENMMGHFFLREGWPIEAKNAAENLLLLARRGVAKRFGRVPIRKDYGLEGVSYQNLESPLTRWLMGEKVVYSSSLSPQTWYDQIRSLLRGFGISPAEVDAKIEAAVFEEQGWPTKANSPGEELLLLARGVAAVKHGGVLPKQGSGAGSQQGPQAPMARWLRGEKIPIGRGRSPKNWYDQIRAFLGAEGFGEAEIVAKIEAAIFEERGWPNQASGPTEELLLLARRSVAIKFGGTIPGHTVGIVGVPQQDPQSPLTRWLIGKGFVRDTRMSPKFWYDQIRSLLVGLGVDETEVNQKIEAAIFEERGWQARAKGPGEELLLLARLGVARKFGGTLSEKYKIGGIPGQTKDAPLNRWLRGDKLDYSPDFNSKIFYAQITTLLADMGYTHQQVDPKIEAAIFEENGWPREAGSPGEDLLLTARLGVARKFGGSLPAQHGIVGLVSQRKNTPLNAWVRGEPRRLDQNLCQQIYAFLTHEGYLSPDIAEKKIAAALQEQEKATLK